MLYLQLRNAEEPGSQLAKSTAQQLCAVVRRWRFAVPLVDEAYNAILVVKVHDNNRRDGLFLGQT